MLQKTLQKAKGVNVADSVRHRVITQGLRYSLATGNWGNRSSGPPQATGVSQVLQRLTYAATLSHLRRVNTPLGRDSKQARPRQLHNTQWGMVCPCETPEGAAVGLVKNMSLMSHVSVGSRDKPVTTMLQEWGMYALEQTSASAVPTTTKVFVNGNWVGMVPDPDSIVTALRTHRRKGLITSEVSVVREVAEQELHVWTDSGRVMRPLYIVETNEEVDAQGVPHRRQQLKITQDHVQNVADWAEEATQVQSDAGQLS